MKYDSEKHHRRSIRLRGYNYARSGSYFVTLCAHKRATLFGEIAGGQTHLNRCGQIVRDEWLRTPEIRSETKLDHFVIMPNHFHAIIRIVVGADCVRPKYGCPINDQGARDAKGARDTGGARSAPLRRQTRSLGSIISGFKSAVTKRINEIRKTPGAHVWQRNYYERIIRNEGELQRIRQYILDNPMRWETDRNNLMHTRALDNAPMNWEES